MKIAELLSKKNARVSVRVPTPRHAEVGAAEVVGTICDVQRQGTVLRVRVKVPRRGYFLFRPQDLTLV
jgi:uncharacterized membrane protein